MKLKAWREYKGLTYQELGESLGISRNFAFKVCAGMHYPKPATVLRIEKISEGMVSADDMLKAWREYHHGH